jgi:hypothetical protein
MTHPRPAARRQAVQYDVSFLLKLLEMWKSDSEKSIFVLLRQTSLYPAYTPGGIKCIHGQRNAHFWRLIVTRRNITKCILFFFFCTTPPVQSWLSQQ